MIVLATDEGELSQARARVDNWGLTAVGVVAPSDKRRLLLVPIADPIEGARLVACFRDDAQPAVMRPSSGVQLEAWSRHTAPVVVGGRVTVCFVWSEHDRRDLPGVVELDPGRGFGTGQHPSTRQLLEEVVTRVQGGDRVLDVGCGSGVLGLCALRAGASSVVAVDIDAEAVETTHRNAVLNGLGTRLEARSVALDAIEGSFDVVLANIGRDALVELAHELIAHLSPKGWLAVSGIAPAHCTVVASALRPLAVVASRTDGDWAALVLARGDEEPSSTTGGRRRR
jgi:ribosomal protein L11 methylase PrmA